MDAIATPSVVQVRGKISPASVLLVSVVTDAYVTILMSVQKPLRFVDLTPHVSTNLDHSVVNVWMVFSLPVMDGHVLN